MEFSLEHTGPLARKATVSVPSATFEGKIDAEIKDAATGLKVPGFRPGKVPMKEVRRRLGATVRGRVARDLALSSLSEAVRERSLSLAAQPRIEIVNLRPGGDFRYVATFEVLPEIKVVPLETLRVRQPIVAIEEADVDFTIEQLRIQRREWEAVSRPAREGDRVKFDYRVMRGDEEVARKEDVALVLGEETNLGLECLMGMTVDETRTVALARPIPDAGAELPDEPRSAPTDAAPAASSAQDEEQEQAAARTREKEEQEGEKKDAEPRREVTVRVVEKPLLPEVDDAFFDWFGVAAGADRLERFRTSVRERMDLEMQTAKRRVVGEEVVRALAAAHPVELPPTLVQVEMRELWERLNVDPNSVPPELAVAERSRIERRLRAELVMQRIVANGSMQAEDSRIRDRIEQIASAYEDAAAVRRLLYADEERLADIERSVLEEQVFEHVTAHAQASPLQVAYQDLVAGKPLPEVASEEIELGAYAEPGAHAADAEPANRSAARRDAEFTPREAESAKATSKGLLGRFKGLLGGGSS